MNDFYIGTEHEGAAVNLKAFFCEAKMDYIPIGVFTSREEAIEFAAKLQGKVDDRRKRNKALSSSFRTTALNSL